MHAHIALFAPEGPQRTFLADNLTYDGFDLTVSSLGNAEKLIAERKPDLAILDTADQTRSALQFLSSVRSARHDDITSGLPIVLVANGPDVDIIRWFQIGADEVITLPIDYPMTRARLAAMLRRRSVDWFPERNVGSLHVNTAARLVTVSDAEVDLFPREFDLLCALAAEPRRVFTKTDLMRLIWNTDQVGTSRTLDSHACRLRRKLADAGAPNHVVNIWGVGYRLC